MRLPWISRKEHDKKINLKNYVIQGWISKCNGLNKDIEVKEDSITNLLDANAELSMENEYLRKRIKEMQDMVKWHQENECELNKALHKKNGELDRMKNTCKMLTGEGE